MLQAVADAAPETGAGPVADDPPEERYARGGLPVPRTGPDLQPGDDAQVDLSESFWMQDMRAGDRPTDPWSEAELAIDEEIKARYAESAPAESPAGPAGEPADEPAGGDPAPEEAAQDPREDAMPGPEDEPPAAPQDDWFAAAQAEIRAMDRPPDSDAGAETQRNTAKHDISRPCGTSSKGVARIPLPLGFLCEKGQAAASCPSPSSEGEVPERSEGDGGAVTDR